MLNVLYVLYVLALLALLELRLVGLGEGRGIVCWRRAQAIRRLVHGAGVELPLDRPGTAAQHTATLRRWDRAWR